MYTVNKGPSKLVAKTRSGLSQNYDKLESFRKDNGNGLNGAGTVNIHNYNGKKELDYSAAKPVFQQYRRSHSHRHNGYLANDVRTGFNELQPMEPPTPQYEELIKYIRDSWDVLSSTDDTNDIDAKNGATATLTNGQVAKSTSQNSTATTQHAKKTTKSTKKVVVYHNDPPSPALRDFGAFDLESWWGRRLFNNITKSLWGLTDRECFDGRRAHLIHTVCQPTVQCANAESEIVISYSRQSTDCNSRLIYFIIEWSIVEIWFWM